MCPSLVRAFGSDFDFHLIKESFLKAKDARKLAAEYTEEMLALLGR